MSLCCVSTARDNSMLIGLFERGDAAIGVRTGIILELIVSEDQEVDIEGLVDNQQTCGQGCIVIYYYYQLMSQGQPVVLQGGVGYFGYCLRVGVLFDFHEQDVLTNKGV
ncbi:MAG: hypothetical protein EZS28_009561 [Streblomastix strix]|uniref:Uncharacterized protein n=1 Tax=Streblomastix strix TaxID=222440 RepID=A0A5J4WIU1_9EUKA|nr:MAG: hypothetical protein EZS28_009561 [Streblomastix strix]